MKKFVLTIAMISFWAMLFGVLMELQEINKKLDGGAKIMVVDQDGDIR